MDALPATFDQDGRDRVTRRALSTVPRGQFGVEPEPWGAPYVPHPDQDNGGAPQRRSWRLIIEDVLMVSAGPRNNIVIHPDDGPTLTPLPQGENSSGCCGPCAIEGLNRACHCGAQVATLIADCYTAYELHLHAKAVRAVD